jgi:hypothetical protein
MGGGYGVLADGEMELTIGKAFIVPAGTPSCFRENINFSAVMIKRLIIISCMYCKKTFKKVIW